MARHAPTFPAAFLWLLRELLFLLEFNRSINYINSTRVHSSRVQGFKVRKQLKLNGLKTLRHGDRYLIGFVIYIKKT
jgi:hypothetical protein